MTRTAITVLGSGSKGNATLLELGDTRILLDAGFSMRQIRRRLEAADCSLGMLDAVCCTHTHTDHIRDISFRILLRHNIPLHFHKGNERFFSRRYPLFRQAREAGLLERFSDEPFMIGGVRVQPLLFPHDSTGVNNGFQFYAPGPGGGEIKISFATDLGVFPDEYHARFAGSDVIVLESNHDLQMLAESDRHEDLKARISSCEGHLSNEQALEALLAILGDPKECATKYVVMVHLSEECNTPELVKSSIGDKLSERGYENLEFHIAKQHEPTESIELAAPLAAR